MTYSCRPSGASQPNKARSWAGREDRPQGVARSDGPKGPTIRRETGAAVYEGGPSDRRKGHGIAPPPRSALVQWRGEGTKYRSEKKRESYAGRGVRARRRTTPAQVRPVERGPHRGSWQARGATVGGRSGRSEHGVSRRRPGRTDARRRARTQARRLVEDWPQHKSHTNAKRFDHALFRPPGRRHRLRPPAILAESRLHRG